MKIISIIIGFLIGGGQLSVFSTAVANFIELKKQGRSQVSYYLLGIMGIAGTKNLAKSFDQGMKMKHKFNCGERFQVKTSLKIAEKKQT